MLYLDAVWLLNLLMDGMILSLTQGLTRAGSSRWRMAAGALAASLIVPVTIYMPDSWLVGSAGKIIFSMGIVLTAFTFTSLRAFFVQWVTFYFVTFAIGGSMMGVHFFLASEVDVLKGAVVTFSGGYGDPVSWLFVAAGCPSAYVFTKWRFNQIQIHQLKYEDVYEVEMTWNGQTAVCKGLVDSGNQLIDPVSRKMVFLADPSVWKQLLAEGELEKLTEEEVLASLHELPETIQSAVRLVPYQAAGISGRLLVTLMIDQITVKTSEGPLVIKQPLVGVQHQPLTRDGLYQMLIHPHVMVKGKSA
ncbi:sigma-E processing peptidase SpoIIGA [Halobacillus litoralis]